MTYHTTAQQSVLDNATIEFQYQTSHTVAQTMTTGA